MEYTLSASSNTVLLVTSDGKEFPVDRLLLQFSHLLNDIDSNHDWESVFKNNERVIKLDDIDSQLFETCLKHLKAKRKYIGYVVVSNDGQKFLVEKDVLCLSPLFAAMIDPEEDLKMMMVSNDQEISVGDISGRMLGRCIEYMRYKKKYMDETDEVPPDFKIDPQEAVELLKTATYLNI